MVKAKKGSNLKHSTWEDQYFDGKIEYYEERDVSPEMKQGANDCIEYIEDIIENEAIRLKQEAQKKYYREPYNSKIEINT